MPLPTPTHCAQLFYDGRCKLCAREMALLRKHQQPGLLLVDIHQLQGVTEEERGQLLRSLHLLMPDGEWRYGPDASVAAWSYTHFGWLLKPLRWPLLAPWVDKLYARWAEQRFCSLYQNCAAPFATAQNGEFK